MNPDAIIILSAGFIAEKDEKLGKTIYRSTTYEEGDAFGTLGGYARVQAAVELAKKYSKAFLVTTGKEGPQGMSAAKIQASELEVLSVSSDRIILEEQSVNTKTQIEEALRIAEDYTWKEIVFITNKYHIKRVQLFVEHYKKNLACKITYQDAESVLAKSDPLFMKEFKKIQNAQAYRVRLESEKRGIEAIRKGIYKPRPMGEKKEK